MSLRHSITTADYLNWDAMRLLIRNLYNNGDYRMSLFIGAGAYFGLRVSDLRVLSWEQLLDNDIFVITEIKTKKVRKIKINKDFQAHIRDCYVALGCPQKDEFCFLSRKGTVYSTQRLNVKLKEIKAKYDLPVEHFSTHSLRKSFGRRVVASAGANAEMALVKLSDIFNHSSIATTRRYLGLREEEIFEVYDSLNF